MPALHGIISHKKVQNNHTEGRYNPTPSLDEHTKGKKKCVLQKPVKHIKEFCFSYKKVIIKLWLYSSYKLFLLPLTHENGLKP